MTLMEKELEDKEKEMSALQSTNWEHVKEKHSLLEASKELNKRIDSLIVEWDTSRTELTEANTKLFPRGNNTSGSKG